MKTAGREQEISETIKKLRTQEHNEFGAILLYAFEFPTFVVDAYTVRLCERYSIEAGKGYAAVKAYFEGNLPKSAEVYNGFHAQIVINAKEHCQKKPLCDGFPLVGTCGRCRV